MKNVKAKNIDDSHVMTGEVRLLYSSLEQGQSQPETGKTVYQGCLLIPKTDTETISLMEDLILRTAKQQWGEKINPKKFLHYPLRDGDQEREGALFNGVFFMNVKTYRPPLLLNVDNTRADAGLLYSGCYGRAALSAYSYDRNGNKGVSISIDAFQFLRDGEAAGNSLDTEALISAFGAVKTDEQTDENPFG